MSTNTKTEVKTTTKGTVVTSDGIRMSYEEWIEMKRSEMN